MLPNPFAPSSVSPPTVFLTGATGYVGATFLQQLLVLPSPPQSITVLIRDEKKGPSLFSLSTENTTIKPVVGDFLDLERLSKLVGGHEVTVETADSDSLDLIQALLEGMRRRRKQGEETVFVHTSGTGTLVDDADG